MQRLRRRASQATQTVEVLLRTSSAPNSKLSHTLATLRLGKAWQGTRPRPIGECGEGSVKRLGELRPKVSAGLLALRAMPRGPGQVPTKQKPQGPQGPPGS